MSEAIAHPGPALVEVNMTAIDPYPRYFAPPALCPGERLMGLVVALLRTRVQGEPALLDTRFHRHDDRRMVP